LQLKLRRGLKDYFLSAQFDNIFP